jgi:hypothetical protein
MLPLSCWQLRTIRRKAQVHQQTYPKIPNLPPHEEVTQSERAADK